MAQMPESEKKILEEVEFLRDRYFTYDEPVPFNGVMLYPVSVRNYNEFLSASQCLVLNKNDDPKGIRMTNVSYLVNKMKDEKVGNVFSLMFTKVVELCLHIKSGLKCSKCGNFMSFEEFFIKVQDPTIVDKNSILICDKCGQTLEETVKFKENAKGQMCFYLDGKEFDNVKFNKLRKYIMYQNLPDYKDDSWVDKTIRDDQAARAEIKSRNSGTATLERKIMGICANTHWKIDEVYSLSIRKFLILLGMIDDIMNYTITRTGLMSGFASLPKGETIEHWLYKKDEGMYGKAIDAESYKSQINKA